MLAIARVSPALSLENLGEAVAQKQQGFARSGGGSAFAAAELEQTLSAQILRFPLGLVNALFRPQLFDVNNFASLVSAIEMTTITWMSIRAVRQHGFGGIVVRIQRSPFLLMCAVVTAVGCTFVGLVTLNFGSLARYRVPFLPFYGTLVAVLSARTAPRDVVAPPRQRAGRRMPPRPAAIQG
jgi:hypothetical protein